MRAALALAIVAVASVAAARDVEDQITVRVVGTLKTGIAAIGCETTGTTITAKGVTWELDLGGQPELRNRADQLEGQKVMVEGSLERRAGVEIPERWIVSVTKLEKPAAAPDKRQQGALEVREQSASAHVAVTEEAGSTRIDIRCTAGVGRATVARRSPQWPATLRVRLYLNGLSSFRATSGPTTVEWSAAEPGGGVILIEPTAERAIDASSPYWTPICIVTQDDAPQLEGNCYEIPLPAHLLEGNPAEIQLSWVDYFRG